MKPSSTDPRLANAYGYLATNLLVLPGLGSYLGGKKNEGLAQMILTLCGMALSLYGLLDLLLNMFRYKSNWLALFGGSEFLILIAGVAVFLTGWLWSFWSAYQIIRESKPEPPLCNA
ncbi:MAG: hypothetical protein ACOY3I_04385 [Verrucomicrobiota bacterium]